MKNISYSYRRLPFLVVPMTLALMAFAGMFPVFDQGPDECPTPGMVEVSVSDTAATIAWRQSDSTTEVSLFLVDLSNPTDTLRTDSISSPYSITGLTGCSRYSIQLGAICGDTISDLTSRLVIETDGCCRIPSGLRFESVSESLAMIEWDAVSEADRFLFRYREAGGDEEDWDTIPTPDRAFVLSELESCTAYEMQVKSTCGLFDTTDFSNVVLLQTTGCGVCTDSMYCEAGGIDATKTWIDSIRIANFAMASGSDDGYFGYLTEQSALERGRTYRFYIDPGFSGEPCPMYLRVWIDLDQDGKFNDSTELLLDTVDMTGNGIGGEFVLGDTLPRDITRLRFAAMPQNEVDTLPPASCGIFDFGEVEDYCIRIDEPCPVAENLDTALVTKESATLIWDKVENAFGYLYTYNEVGDDPGELMTTGDTTVELTGLDKCTEYAFRLYSVCPQDSNSQVLIFKTKCESAVEDLSPLFSDINIYPNPFRDQISIAITASESLTGQLQMFTSTGQMVHIENLNLSAGQSLNSRLDLNAELPNGMYFLVIRSDKGVLSRKVIKSGY